jgi:hypothetical protein
MMAGMPGRSVRQVLFMLFVTLGSGLYRFVCLFPAVVIMFCVFF